MVSESWENAFIPILDEASGWWRVKLLYFGEFYLKIWDEYNFSFYEQIPKEGSLLFLF